MITCLGVNLESYVRSSLKELHFHPRRLRGQNFLVDESAQEVLARRALLCPDDIVIEVGTGLGTLTRRLAREAGQVFTFEIEDFFFPFLEREFADFPNIRLIKKSFNSYSLGELLEELELDKPADDAALQSSDSPPDASHQEALSTRKVKICANLPYQISTLFIRAVIEYVEWIDIVCVMLQREVAERLAAAPGSRAYGSLSVWAQTYYGIDLLSEIPPESFIPQPKVKSTIIAMTPRAEIESESIPESGFFFELVSGIFQHRRKTVENAIKGAFPRFSISEISKALDAAKIPSRTRPEQIDRVSLIKLANALEDSRAKDGTGIGDDK